jgi:hypothetical protein
VAGLSYQAQADDFAWLSNRFASPKTPKKRSAPAIAVTIELRIVVVVPTEPIRLAIWSVGSESVRAKPTTL